MKRSLNREILRLTLPAILSNIMVPMLGLCDTAITGHLGSEVFIAAVSIGTLMYNTVFWLFGFLRSGTTGLTAQAYGQGGRAACGGVLSRAFFLGLACGIGLVALQWPVSRLLMWIISAEPEVADLALYYYSVCIWSAPALLATMALQGWLIGMQTTTVPMIVSITVSALNVVLSLVFVYLCDMGFAGVAWGTLVANWVGLGIAWVLARWYAGRGLMRMRMRHLVEGEGLRRFFTVNTDIFLRSGCMLAVSMACGAYGARIGALVVAANAVLLNFFSFFSYFMDGFAFAGEALTGRFAGQGDRPMLLKSVRYLIWWGVGCAVLFFGIYWAGCGPIVRFITDTPEVVEYAMSLKPVVVLLPPITVMAFLFDGFFIGLTATRRMLVVTAIAAAAFFLMAWVHPWQSGGAFGMPDNVTLWVGFLVYLFLRGVLLAAMSPKVFSLRKPLPAPL